MLHQPVASMSWSLVIVHNVIMCGFQLNITHPISKSIWPPKSTSLAKLEEGPWRYFLNTGPSGPLAIGCGWCWECMEWTLGTHFSAWFLRDFLMNFFQNDNSEASSASASLTYILFSKPWSAICVLDVNRSRWFDPHFCFHSPSAHGRWSDPTLALHLVLDFSRLNEYGHPPMLDGMIPC